MRPSGKNKGFTLAELLIALAILGVIATFTIPKVLQVQGNAEYNAKAKEAAGFMSSAYQLYQQQNGSATALTKLHDLTPFLNYVKVDSTSTYDDEQGAMGIDCSATTCLVLHNGAILELFRPDCFGGTSTTHGVWFGIDPDGKYSNSTTGSGKAVHFFLYYNGRLATSTTVQSNSQTDWDCNSGLDAQFPTAGADPPWFSW